MHNILLLCNVFVILVSNGTYFVIMLASLLCWQTHLNHQFPLLLTNTAIIGFFAAIHVCLQFMSKKIWATGY